MADAAVAPTSGPPLSKPSFDLSGKHYIVTGGTQGLGLEIARQLKACGAAKLTLMSRTPAKGEPVAKELSSGGCTASFIAADMSDPASLISAVGEAIKVMDGRVDGLVNAAGDTTRGNLLDTSVELFDKQFHVNTRGPFFLTQAVAKHMIEKEIRGAVVNISSLAANHAAPFITAYGGSKAALNLHTKCHAAELAPYGIRVTGISMGWTLTDTENARMVGKLGEGWLALAEPGVLPMKRMLRPVDVACTACFLLSPAAQMMTGTIVEQHPDYFNLFTNKAHDTID